MVALPLGDVIDFAKERARLEKELKKAEDEIARFDAKLSNEQFVARAPEEVLAEQREKRAEAAALAARLAEAVKRLAMTLAGGMVADGHALFPSLGFALAGVIACPHCSTPESGRLAFAQPHRDGAADPFAGPSRYPRAQRPGGRILRPARRLRPDHLRSHQRDADGRGLCRHAGHLVGRTDRRLGEGHPRRARQGRAHAAAALACRPHLRSHVSGRRAAGSAQRHPAQGPCQPGAAGKTLSSRPARWRRRKSPASSPPTDAAPRTPSAPASTAWRSTAPMAICWTSSCRIPPIIARDAYGGSREKRARLMLEVADACAEVWGADRVGMHLAPRMRQP